MACGLMFAPRASSESREPAGLICAKTAGVRASGGIRADNTVDDAEAEQAVGLTQHGHRVGAAGWGLARRALRVLRLLEYQAT